MTESADVAAFAKKYIATIYEGSESPFLLEEDHPAKGKFISEFCDLIGFYHQKDLVGFFLGHPSDWSTYYMRNTSVLPQYQDKGLLQVLIQAMEPVLRKHQVHRVVLEVSPSNFRNLHLCSKYGANPTGQKNCERYGALIQFTKFLSPVHEAVFLKQFCAGVKPQTKKKD